MFSFRSTLAIVLCCSFFLTTTPSELVAISSKANPWAQTSVKSGSQEEIITLLNCAYLSYEMTQIDAIVRVYTSNVIYVAWTLRQAITSYEAYEDAMKAMHQEIENLSVFTTYRTRLLEQWQASIKQCENVTNKSLTTALEQMHKHAESLASQWQHHATKPLDTLAKSVNTDLGDVMKKIEEITKNYQLLSEGKKVPVAPEAQKLPDNLASINLFDINCQELAICGFVLMQTADEAIGRVAQALQESPSKVFLAYYTALFKTYQAKYGKDTAIPFTFAPYTSEKAEDNQLPNPEVLWANLTKAQ